MSQIIDSENGFEYTLLESGDWIWKAIKPTPLSKKKILRERPQFKVSTDIEKKYHQRFDKSLFEGVKDITRYLTKTAYD